MASILTKLYREDVVSFELNEEMTAVTVCEECDEWFHVVLNKQEVAQLIQELQELHDQMVSLN